MKYFTNPHCDDFELLNSILKVDIGVEGSLHKLKHLLHYIQGLSYKQNIMSIKAAISLTTCFELPQFCFHVSHMNIMYDCTYY